MPIELIVSPASTGGPGRRFSFDSDRITIGRNSGNSLVLPDDTRVVSNLHAEIQMQASKRVLVDLGSTNYTLLNGKRLLPHQPYPVENGDNVRIGPFSIEVSISPDEVPALSFEGGASSSTGPLWEDMESTRHDPTGLKRTLSELAFLNEMTREIGSARDVGGVVERVVERSVQAIGAEQGVITLVQEAEATEDDAHAKTFVRSGGKEPFHVNQDLLGWMQTQMRPLRLDDVPNDPASRLFGWPRSLKSALCVPLIVRSELTGILSLFNSRRTSGFSEDDQRLLTIIAGQSAQIIENARLHEEEKTLIKMQQELKTAYRIQEHLLPNSAPDIRGYEVAGRSVPAETVGGDYFDYIPINERQWALCVGDVSGKGLPAALVMANLQATLRAQAAWSESVAQTIERSNQLLCQSTSPSTFVTLFYGVLDLHEHTFTWANAGHNRPYLVRASGEVTTLEGGGLVLGFLPQQRYEASTLHMHPGDTVVIYSDGVTECMDLERREFGDEALEALLARAAGRHPEELIAGILRAIGDHARGAPASDDVTMLVLRRT